MIFVTTEIDIQEESPSMSFANISAVIPDAPENIGEIEVAPLAFMRGRTLARSYVILDEAQNATSM